jgi:hypothetical protein
MKKLTELAIILVLFGISSWAQEVRHEVTVQGSGFFQKQTTAGGITNEPTNSGGVMAGYRFNLKNWLAVEGDYDYFRNHQTFSGSIGTTSIPMNVHAATGVAIVKLPSFKMPPSRSCLHSCSLEAEPCSSIHVGILYAGDLSYLVLAAVSMLPMSKHFSASVPWFVYKP